MTETAKPLPAAFQEALEYWDPDGRYTPSSCATCRHCTVYGASDWPSVRCPHVPPADKEHPPPLYRLIRLSRPYSLMDQRRCEHFEPSRYVPCRSCPKQQHVSHCVGCTRCLQRCATCRHFIDYENEIGCIRQPDAPQEVRRWSWCVHYEEGPHDDASRRDD